MNRRLGKIIFYADVIFILLFILSRWKVHITLNGDDTVNVPYGHAFVDPGATAAIEGKDIHIFDGELEVKSENDIDPYTIGTYTVKYRASRLFYSSEVLRTVNVIEDDAPVIVLDEVNTRLDSGDVWYDSYRAYDDRDGDLTAQVQVSGYVDQTMPGQYDLTYSVTDSSGNTAYAARSVYVVGVSQPISGSKIVFLTFDDGPWSSTDRLLDILAEHNVKVTFFVTGNHPESFDCITREYNEGHTVAVHSYTHVFDQIYTSTEAYWSDFDRMNDTIAEYTGGFRSTLFRFPGGSSNTISSYNQGIMSRLVAQASELGYEYFDWNVDCGDGGGEEDPQRIYENIIAGIRSNDVSVVLCHDTHGRTVDAIENVLTWGEENGYTFLPLVPGITVCHHNVAN